MNIKSLLAKEGKHKEVYRVYSLCFLLHEVQKKAELSYSKCNQKSG